MVAAKTALAPDAARGYPGLLMFQVRAYLPSITPKAEPPRIPPFPMGEPQPGAEPGLSVSMSPERASGMDSTYVFAHPSLMPGTATFVNRWGDATVESG
jgi:hypothetical protein